MKNNNKIIVILEIVIIGECQITVRYEKKSSFNGVSIVQVETALKSWSFKYLIAQWSFVY